MSAEVREVEARIEAIAAELARPLTLEALMPDDEDDQS